MCSELAAVESACVGSLSPFQVFPSSDRTLQQTFYVPSAVRQDCCMVATVHQRATYSMPVADFPYSACPSVQDIHEVTWFDWMVGHHIEQQVAVLGTWHPFWTCIVAAAAVVVVLWGNTHWTLAVVL